MLQTLLIITPAKVRFQTQFHLQLVDPNPNSNPVNFVHPTLIKNSGKFSNQGKKLKEGEI